MNSWCKVVDGKVVDGPRAWSENTPPDDTWLPHRLEETPHTINDNYIGSEHEVRGNEVVEVKKYSPKSAEQIADEIESIKSLAARNIQKADEKLANPELANRPAWEAYRSAWEPLLTITVLSWAYYMPSEPRD